MNKLLFEKVKAKCKDNGLSEKYLKAITEKIGGSVEDDSTDETAIEEMANQIADIAGETQGEATRWASKKDSKEKEKEKEKESESEKEKQPEKDSETAKEINSLKEKLALLEGNATKSQRDAAIKAAQEKHKIPDWRMKGVAIPDDQDPETYLAEIKQDLITQKLMPADSEGVKTVTEKQVDEAANSLLESITVK